MRCIAVLLVCAAAACAQDPFEIHVYEYDPMPLGSFTYEAHLNYILNGTTAFDGAVAPTRHQFHFTSESTVGLGDSLALGTMLLTAVRPDQSLEYAGCASYRTSSFRSPGIYRSILACWPNSRSSGRPIRKTRLIWNCGLSPRST
jgi:hypothetical protein